MSREHRNPENLGHVITTDLLVLGGGLGGLWASIEAKKYVDNVLIVDKGPLNWGGIGNMSGGDMVVCLPEDDIMKWIDDLVYYFDGLIEQDVIEDLMQRSYDRFLDYEGMTHKFARDEQGNLKRVKQRGLDHVSALLSRPFCAGGQG
jgi:succinate dehydrogenase / fumarate reductase flavoprotein subunit